MSRISSSLRVSVALAMLAAGCSRQGGPDAPMFRLIEAMVAIELVAAALAGIALLVLVVALMRAAWRGERNAAVGLAVLLLGGAMFGGYVVYERGGDRPVLPYRSVSGGREHACGVDASGHVLCLGWDDHGASGPSESGGTYAPRLVAGLGSASSVSAGNETSCALLADRTVRCWGVDPRAPDGARSG